VATEGDVTMLEAIGRTPPAPEFTALYEAHVDGIWRFLERLGVPDANLDDAVQDVFIVAHRQLAGFRGASTVKTWLHAIAHKVAKDHRRREHRKGGWEPLEPTVPDEARGPDERFTHRQQLETVLTMLDQLEDVQRTVFVLTEFEGMTAPEVAEVTESNVNTVSSRLRAARLRFDELVTAWRNSQAGEAR
jgi:RNA polymerase sigma-70 factor, ECF subfamily